MSTRGDIMTEIEKSDDGRQTIDQTAEAITRIMGLSPEDRAEVRMLVGESGLDAGDLADEILDAFDDDDLPEDFDDYDDEEDDDYDGDQS